MHDFALSAVSPAIRSGIEAQLSLYGDISRNVFNAFQRLNELNVQVAQTVVEESLASTQELLSSRNHLDAISVVTGQVQPAAEKMRAYQQHLENIVAETQVNLAKTAESHLPEATRAAEELVKEATQKASEETEKATQRQQEVMEKLTNPIKRQSGKSGNGQEQTTRNPSMENA